MEGALRAVRNSKSIGVVGRPKGSSNAKRQGSSGKEPKGAKGKKAVSKRKKAARGAEGASGPTGAAAAVEKGVRSDQVVGQKRCKAAEGVESSDERDVGRSGGKGSCENPEDMEDEGAREGEVDPELRGFDGCSWRDEMPSTACTR